MSALAFGPGTSVTSVGSVREANSSLDGVGPPSRLARASSSALDDRLALLAEVLLDVVEAAAGLAGGAGALPSAERLHAGPGAGGGAGLAVHVHHAGLDASQELVDLGPVLGVEAGRQAVLGVVCPVEGLVERVDRTHRHERHEQLVLPYPVVERRFHDGGPHEQA